MQAGRRAGGKEGMLGCMLRGCMNFISPTSSFNSASSASATITAPSTTLVISAASAASTPSTPPSTSPVSPVLARLLLRLLPFTHTHTACAPSLLPSPVQWDTIKKEEFLVEGKINEISPHIKKQTQFCDSRKRIPRITDKVTR